jgi:hypothetical protein
MQSIMDKEQAKEKQGEILEWLILSDKLEVWCHK